MVKSNIRTNPQECKGCLICHFRCSLAYTKVFNPEKARIKIDPLKEIIFTDDCIEGCTLCARNCPFGALEIIG